MLSNTKEDLEFVINKLRKILINKSKRSISVDII